MKHIAFLLSDT